MNILFLNKKKTSTLYIEIGEKKEIPLLYDTIHYTHSVMQAFR